MCLTNEIDFLGKYAAFLWFQHLNCEHFIVFLVFYIVIVLNAFGY